jgi:hypothetical protein
MTVVYPLETSRRQKHIAQLITTVFIGTTKELPASTLPNGDLIFPDCRFVTLLSLGVQGSGYLFHQLRFR